MGSEGLDVVGDVERQVERDGQDHPAADRMIVRVARVTRAATVRAATVRAAVARVAAIMRGTRVARAAAMWVATAIRPG
ncbi:hypothetical protein GCM10010517_67660 [Streptosporangium fragile]|uniref:Uncharacterized protein n=1 Tax=Streptosporangium fragile TaxID=46186 RepID=A0ABN3W7H7_9ACTN